MPVDYAEATKLQDFKVEVFQPGNDTPTLRKPTNSPTYETAPGQLTVPNRDSGLGKPNNLPARQDSLRNDGQYRTIDVTPTNTAKPAPSKQLNQLSNGTAGEAAMAELAYYAGFLIDGFIDGTQNKNPFKQATRTVLTPAESVSYQTGNMAGQEARDLTKDAIKNGEELLDNLWINKPTFEIPQIKIPKFNLPELPDLEIPKFPEFKFPEISFPKPQPVDFPKPQLRKPSLTEQLEHVDILDCGGGTMKIAYVRLITGKRYRDLPGGGSIEELVYSQSDIEAFTRCYIKEAPANANATTSQILEGAGQTGFNFGAKEGNLRFNAFPFISQVANIEGSTAFIQAVALTIDILKNGSIKEILGYLHYEGLQPEVYYFDTDLPDKAGCSPPFPLPPPTKG